jgi:hypothetical protein
MLFGVLFMLLWLSGVMLCCSPTIMQDLSQGGHPTGQCGVGLNLQTSGSSALGFRGLLCSVEPPTTNGRKISVKEAIPQDQVGLRV